MFLINFRKRDPLFKIKNKYVFDNLGNSYIKEYVSAKTKNILSPAQKNMAKTILDNLHVYNERELINKCLNEKALKKIKNGNVIDYSHSLILFKTK